MSYNELPTEADVEFVLSTREMSFEERELAGKEMSEQLAGETTDELVERCHRIGNLYWKAAVMSPRFHHGQVDVLASAVLLALEHSPKEDEQVTLAAADHLLRARNASRNTRGHVTPLDSVGVAARLQRSTLPVEN